MSTLQDIDMTELAYETLTLYYETSSLSSSVLDSVSVLDVVTDHGRLPHCGTIFLVKARSLSPDSPVVIIPKIKNISDGEWESSLTISSQNVSKVEHGSAEDFEVLCFYLKRTNTDKKRIRVFFILEEEQMKIAIKELPGIFHTKVPLHKEEKAKITCLILSNKVLSKFDTWKTKKQLERFCVESQFKDYIRPYIYFSKQWPQRHLMKEKLASYKNLPLLLKRMKFDDKLIRRALVDFIRLHKCRNKHCQGFSSNKCSGCKHVRYCDANCQQMDFAKHIKLCQKMKKENRKAFYVGQILQRELQSRIDEPKLYSFEFFVSNVLTRVFEAFSDHLSESFLQNIILEDVRKHNIENIDWINLQKLSTQSSEVEWRKLRTQMEHQFGEENFLSQDNSRTESGQSQRTGYLWDLSNTCKQVSYVQAAYTLLFISWFLMKIYKVFCLGLPFSSW